MSAEIIYGVSIYATISNIWFFLVAFSSDVLWIRMYLLLAYCFLLTAGLTNFATWGHWDRAKGNLWQLGQILWPFCLGIIHVVAFIPLVWDERKVIFKSELEEQLWRMVHRRSGMGRLEFQHALKLGKVMHYKAGEVIFDIKGTTAAEGMSLHLMIEGLGAMTVRHSSQDLEKTLRSGDIFDWLVFNFFGVYIGLEQTALERVVAMTNVTLVKWDVEAVEEMANGSYPALAASWRNFILYTLASAFSQTYGMIYASNGQREHPDFLKGGRSQDMLEPFEPGEDGALSWMDWIKWLIRIHNPIAPKGFRHNSMPTSGMLARGRMHALAMGKNIDGCGSGIGLPLYSSKSFRVDPCKSFREDALSNV